MTTKDSNRDRVTIRKHTLILSLVIVVSLSVFLVVLGPLSSSLLLSPIKVRAQQQPTSRPQQPSSIPSSSSQQPTSQPQRPSSQPSSQPEQPSSQAQSSSSSSPTTSSNLQQSDQSTATSAAAAKSKPPKDEKFCLKHPSDPKCVPGPCTPPSSCPPGQKGTCEGVICPPGQPCEGRCTSILKSPCSSNADCGTLGSSNLICVNGQCECPVPLEDCGDYCADLSSNSDCGACGNRCASNQECVDNPSGSIFPFSCHLACPTGQKACDLNGNGNEQCVDPLVAFKSDPNNCGGCNIICNANQICQNYFCTECPAGQTACSNPPRCVDDQTDPKNCGSCGNICPSGQTCSSGTCQLQCQAGQSLCNGQCVDPATAFQSDPKNCGACGNVCPPTTPACQNGQCVCGSDLNCPNSDNTGTFACRVSGTGVNACLQCTSDSQCLSGSYCVGSAGLCCPTGWGTCIGGGTTCFDFTSDFNHCGGCTSCSSRQCTSDSASCKFPGSDIINCNIPGCCGLQCNSCVNSTCKA